MNARELSGGAFVTPESLGTWEDFSRARSVFSSGLKIGTTVAGPMTLWSLPVALSAYMPSGKALVTDTSTWAVAIGTGKPFGDTMIAAAPAAASGEIGAGSLSVRWFETGDDFTKNQVHLRVEGRMQVTVFQPNGLCVVNLNAE